MVTPPPTALLSTLGAGAVLAAVALVIGLALLWAIRAGGAARQQREGERSEP
jgi:nitrogen fixation-related uncharacterized protein